VVILHNLVQKGMTRTRPVQRPAFAAMGTRMNQGDTDRCEQYGRKGKIRNLIVEDTWNHDLVT